MADENETPASDMAASKSTNTEQKSKEKAEHRDIKGNIPYVTSPGVFKKALDLIVTAERPDKFTYNFISTILNITGGSARAIPPMLKKMQFIEADATPTILYSRFKTEGGRSEAAFLGLRNAFGELFKRNEFIHKADEATIKDIIVEITGLKKNDSIVRLMYSTFDAIRSFITADIGQNTNQKQNNNELENEREFQNDEPRQHDRKPSVKLGLSYQINIVLPETDNIDVFNAIFRSLRENMLQ